MVIVKEVVRMDARGMWIALPENESATRAIKHFADTCVRGMAHPLLLLHGPAGSGKSHLAAELVQRFLIAQPDKTTQTVAAADIGRELQLPPIERQDLFRSLVSCDLLIIEDIQHLPGNSGDDMTTVIDRRLNRRKNVLITSATAPAQLRVAPRLASRLVGGLTVSIAPLALASRQTLAEAFCAERSLRVAPEVVAWLARHPSGARPILGEVQQLSTLTTMFPPPLTLEIIQRELTSPTEDRSPLERIIDHVGEHFRVSPKMLCGKSRLKNVVWPRQVAMYLARQQGLSLTVIGQRFSKRDHTTVIHSCAKVEQRLQCDPVLVQTLQELQAKLA